MKLSRISLAGFKSFADPTVIEVADDMTGVVGPNGCGKSNIVDAVRWVMGHAARDIRGANLQDVIFSGTRARKPVGQASVELVFDNADGALGGQYASYGEISVKRAANRGQESKYYINNTRCRRRDVADLFFGTGLGGHGYALVQQGMIARIIEAKPEEMRLYLEEAAGVSQYHERRRDTETRMRHTRENLERVLDIRDEVAQQADKLKRQARSAERFNELKRRREMLAAQLAVLELQEHERECAARDRRVSEVRVRLDANQADLRRLEAELEKSRAALDEHNRSLNDARERFYRLSADVAGAERDIAARKKSAQQIRRERETITGDVRQCAARIAEQESRLAENQAAWEHSQEKIDAARADGERCERALEEAERQLADTGREWERHHGEARQSLEMAEVGRVKLEYSDKELEEIEQGERQIAERRAALEQTAVAARLTEARRLHAEREQAAAALEREHDELGEALAAMREQQQQLQARLHDERVGLQGVRGRLASLEALQQADLGHDREAFTEWRKRHGLHDAAQMATAIEVEDGWEAAVELVLDALLEGLEVDSLDNYAGHVGRFAHGRLALFERTADAGAARPRPTLADKVHAGGGAAPLRNVYPVDGLEQALRERSSLADHESLITRDGIWVGRHWLRLHKGDGGDAAGRGGVLLRRKTIERLAAEVGEAERKVSRAQHESETARRRLAESEARLQELQGERAVLLKQVAESGADMRQCEMKLRHDRELSAELDEAARQLAQRRESAARRREELSRAHREALSSVSARDADHADLQRRRAACEQRMGAAKKALRETQQASHRLEIERQSLAASLAGIRENVAQARQQKDDLERRGAALKQVIAESQDPLEHGHRDLDALVRERAGCERAVSDENEKLESAQARIRELDGRHKELEAAREELRQRHEQARMEWQASRVRCQEWHRKIEECRWTRDELERDLDPDMDLAAGRDQAESLARRIQRLGAINLAAAEEFAELSERKDYLDSQHADLAEALTTLGEAIARIDRESREKFKDTFDNVNRRLGDAFARLFGGGQAYLQLNENDWLKGGVSIMVRPPGKRLSSISLLSGGEKALSALAVVFSIFDLKPAPFCVLDEVDAPLDENNVLRFCELLGDMKERVQFIVITHNRLTMENMGCLIGVTMGEPGVSRLVSVNVEEAARMAG